MAWQQLRSGAWCNRLEPLAPNWWIGWSSAGGFQLLRQIEAAIPLAITLRFGSSGWLDCFLGQAEMQPASRRSIIDPRAKVAIHYLLVDRERIRQLPCPQQVSLQLWQKLQKKLN